MYEIRMLALGGLRPTAIPCANNAECWGEVGRGEGQGCTYLETGRTEKPWTR